MDACHDSWCRRFPRFRVVRVVHQPHWSDGEGNGLINIGPPLSDLLTLAGRVSDRLISEEAALRSAQAQQHAFTPSELAVFFAVSGELFKETPDDAYCFFRLALALAETKWGRDRHSQWWQTADCYIETTRETLLKAPRASRLNHAIATAQQQIDILKGNIERQRRGWGRLSANRRALIDEETKELADTLQGAGWLLAAPYCIMLDPDDLADSFTNWLAPYKLDFVTFHSPMELGNKVGQEGFWKGSRIGSMPHPAQALPRAMEYLNEALRYAPPSLRHSCEVKRAQVLSLLARVDPERGEEHWQQAEVALRRLDHDITLNELPETLRALALRSRLAGAPSVGSVPFPVKNLRENLPPATALGILTDLVVLVDSRDVAELWGEIHAICANSVRLPMISPRFWTALAHRTPGNRRACPTAMMPYSVLLPDVEEECERLAVPAPVRAATLVHAALHVREDDIADVIELLDHIHLVDQGFADTYAEMVDYVLMQSRKRYAERLASQGDNSNALLQYACAAELAARFAMRHSMPGFGTRLINKSIECVDQLAMSDYSFSTTALLQIAEPVVTGIVGALEHHAAFVYGLGQRTMSYLLARSFPDDVNIALHHILFKGFDFRILSHNSGPRTKSPIVADLHREISALEAATGPYAPGTGFEESEDGIAGISALYFVSSAEIIPAQQVDPTIENLRRVADRDITRYLIFGSYEAEGFQLLRPGCPRCKISSTVWEMTLFSSHCTWPREGWMKLVLWVSEPDLWPAMSRASG